MARSRRALRLPADGGARARARVEVRRRHANLARRLRRLCLGLGGDVDGGHRCGVGIEHHVPHASLRFALPAPPDADVEMSRACGQTANVWFEMSMPPEAADATVLLMILVIDASSSCGTDIRRGA